MKIGILGIGAWATAIANLIAETENQVVVWSFEKDTIEQILERHENTKYLPGFPVSSKIQYTDCMEEIIDSEIIIQATPTQFIRQTLEKNKVNLSSKPILNVAKGIEKGSLKRISVILRDFGCTEENYAVLTGPSHAEEVAAKIPTATVVASENRELARTVQTLLSNAYFRVYSSEDVIGCEMGGALKNVIAIAAGIIDGLKLGDNTKAALITRGLAEISRLGVSLGAKPLTFSGLSGLGDLVVTCISRHSRNRFVGENIAKGKTLDEILSNMDAVAEGVDTTVSAYLLGQKQNVEMPITKKVYEILFENLDPKIALNDLMLRQTKPEWWW
jgi:glycerol-3-phosphate dehydrogenase (NAD(P)+)